MEEIDDSDVPDTGAVFTYGLSRFGDNEPGKFWIRNDKALQIACGEEHTVVIVESGRAFSFGKNDWGQLGIGNTLSLQTKPVCIKALKLWSEKARLVACGRNHTIISTESGSLYGMGSNGDRQLGVESKEETVPSPVLIQSDKDYAMLSAGGEMTAVLLSSGDLLTWGANSEGQCGVSSVVDPISTPTRVRLPGKVMCMSCGYYHAAAVLEDGRLFTWGEAEGGKLGLGPDVNDSQDTPQEVRVPEPMRSVSCGNNHTVAVAASGRLYTWGEGPAGQLGLGEDEDHASQPRAVKFVDRKLRIKAAEAGDSHTVAVSEDGRVFAFGDARHGKLGLMAPDSDAQSVWRPEEVQRFPDSKLVVHSVSCGGCHTILLGGWQSEEPESIVRASVRTVESTPPQPVTRRRHRDRPSNGETRMGEERLSRTLPPLRRASTQDDRRSDEGFGSQAPTQNGENSRQRHSMRHYPFKKSHGDVSDTDESKGKNKKSNFDDMLLNSKFDNMLAFDDEGEEKVVPPPRRSLRGKKENPPSTSAYAVNDRNNKNGSTSFAKTSSLRREQDSEDEEDEDNKIETKPQNPKSYEEEMEEESTRRRKGGHGKTGMFSKRSALHDDDDNEDYDNRSPNPANRSSKPPDKTSVPETSSTDPNRELIFGGDRPQNDPDTKKVRVGCGGGGGGTSNDEDKKSKSCILL